MRSRRRGARPDHGRGFVISPDPGLGYDVNWDDVNKQLM